MLFVTLSLHRVILHEILKMIAAVLSGVCSGSRLAGVELLEICKPMLLALDFLKTDNIGSIYGTAAKRCVVHRAAEML